MQDLKLNLRAEIDAIDKQIASLLRDRFALAKAIGETKKASGLLIKDLTREQEVLKNVLTFANNEDEKNAILSIYQAIIDECCKLQK